MKKIILFLLLVVAVAAVSAWCSARFAARCGGCAPARTACGAHDWLHEKLQLTPAQSKELEPIEARFHERYSKASGELAEANRELAGILGRTDSFSPDVAAAIEKVHHRMGELQKLSIEHLYDMRPVLTPEQNKRLLQYAQQALENQP